LVSPSKFIVEINTKSFGESIINKSAGISSSFKTLTIYYKVHKILWQLPISPYLT
jgi:hypothetical protein